MRKTKNKPEGVLKWEKAALELLEAHRAFYKVHSEWDDAQQNWLKANREVEKLEKSGGYRLVPDEKLDKLAEAELEWKDAQQKWLDATREMRFDLRHRSKAYKKAYEKLMEAEREYRKADRKLTKVSSNLWLAHRKWVDQERERGKAHRWRSVSRTKRLV